MFRRVRGLGFPRSYPLVQFPNGSLMLAYASGLLARVSHGRTRTCARAASRLAMWSWAYGELAHGANLFRRLLGLGYAVRDGGRLVRRARGAAVRRSGKEPTRMRHHPRLNQHSHKIEREQLVPAPLEQVFEFFSRARNLEELTPPWLRFSVLTPEPIAMGAGTLIEYRLHVHGMPLGWVSRIEEWEPGERFVDLQVRGPYRLWRHTHEFLARPQGTLIRDSVEYELPFGRLGSLAHAAIVRRDLERVFDYRRQSVERLFPRTGGPT